MSPLATKSCIYLALLNTISEYRYLNGTYLNLIFYIFD